MEEETTGRIIQLGNYLAEEDAGDTFAANRQRGRVYSPDGIAPCLSGLERDNNAPKITQMEKDYPQEAGKKRYRLRIRKLTEREVLRLMGVEETYIERMMQSGVARGQIYKAAGNSIVVPCIAAIFDSLLFPTGQHHIGKQGQLELF